MTDTNEPNSSNDSSLDSLIERTLSRDADATRSRFATVPNARLTAKLAIATASRGLFRSLAGKLALYAGGALVAGCAIYFFPSIMRQPNSGLTAEPLSGMQQSVQQPLPGTERTEATETPAKTTVSRPVSKTDSIGTSNKIATDVKPHTLQLDDGDDKNIPKYTDPNYHSKIK